MALLPGTTKTGVIVRTPDETTLHDLSHFFIDSIYHYQFGKDFVLVEDFQFTVDQLMEMLESELNKTDLVDRFTLERNEI
jgi:hypothetical protein